MHVGRWKIFKVVSYQLLSFPIWCVTRFERSSMWRSSPSTWLGTWKGFRSGWGCGMRPLATLMVFIPPNKPRIELFRRRWLPSLLGQDSRTPITRLCSSIDGTVTKRFVWAQFYFVEDGALLHSWDGDPSPPWQFLSPETALAPHLSHEFPGLIILFQKLLDHQDGGARAKGDSTDP